MGSDFLYYIQESDKPNFWLNIFNIVKLQYDKIILPILGDKKISYKKAKKLAKKINKILTKTNCKTVVISKKIKQQEEFINYLYTYNYEILDGKKLFTVLSEKVVNYIIEKKNLDKQNLRISILVNDLSDIILEIIKKMVMNYKRVNIVTNHVEKFKNIEENMMDYNGIALIVNNNKKRSLIKSNIILNFDFPTELINKYQIFDEAIIINLKHKIKINKKRFNGLNISDYDIEYNENIEELDYDKFYKKDVFESKLYNKQPFEEIMKKIKKDGVKIIQLKSSNTTL